MDAPPRTNVPVRRILSPVDLYGFEIERVQRGEITQSKIYEAVALDVRGAPL
jgi:hypothetical protein